MKFGVVPPHRVTYRVKYQVRLLRGDLGVQVEGWNLCGPLLKPF